MTLTKTLQYLTEKYETDNSSQPLDDLITDLEASFSKNEKSLLEKCKKFIKNGNFAVYREDAEKDCQKFGIEPSWENYNEYLGTILYNLYKLYQSTKTT